MLFGTNGGIAQLGERLNGIQEVMGSNPTISIFRQPYKLKKTQCFQGFVGLLLCSKYTLRHKKYPE